MKVKKITNDRGYAKSADIPYGTYKVVETTFPFNYEASGQTEWTVTINTAKGALATINATNQLKKGYVEILKSDAESGKDLSGAEFTVYDYDGEEIAVIGPTNSDGYAKSGEIIYGDYIVKETKVPMNYQPEGDAEWHITIDDNSPLITLDIANLRQYGSVKVVKTAEDGLVEGMVFTLTGTSVYGENGYIEEHGQFAYIKPSNYEISKTRKYQADISNRENMVYDEEKDCYRCSQGNLLKAAGSKQRQTASGYIATKVIYKCCDCTDCPVKGRCIKGNHWKVPESERFKSLEVSRRFERQRAESLKRITSQQGIILRINRSIQSEGSFADLKWDRGFRRFLCRGSSNVYAECVLLAISHNIEKLHNKIQHGKTGAHLHCEEKVA